MREIEQTISNFIERQFPSFYIEEGPLFILFAQEYFKWLESASTTTSTTQTISGGSIHHARNLMSYRDIDTTIDEFLIHFKNTFLNGIDFDTIVNKRLLVKAAKNLYQSKGTERSFNLLFNLAFGTNVNVYYPGDDLLKPSDGTWVIPVYLELSRSSKTTGFVGKPVTGSISGATAFVEYLITRNIKGKLIDIAYLSQLQGNFQKGDIVTIDGIVEGSPRIVGSLSTIDMTTSGAGFVVGEEVSIVSARGTEGRARVMSVEQETGKVNFSILEPGWGYSVDADTYVSTKVFKYSSLLNANASITGFDRSEYLHQPLYNLTCNNVAGELEVGELLFNYDSNTATIAYIQGTSGSNTVNVYVQPISGSILSNNIIFSAGQAIIATDESVQFLTGQSLTQHDSGSSTDTTGKITQSSNVTILTIDSGVPITSNGIHVGSYVKQLTSNAVGYIRAVDREAVLDATAVSKVIIGGVTGTFHNTYSFTTYTDSSLATSISTATPNGSVNGYMYTLGNVSIGSARWSTSNTVVLTSAPSTNTTILIASDVGGMFSSNAVITATGVLMGPNTSSNTIGVRSVNNTFYATGNTQVIGQTSNTYANIFFVSTGSGAAFNIGLVGNTETVLVATEKIISNNDGPGSSSISYADMIINGVNSGYGNLSSVSIFNGGTGYDNTNIITFTGGNTGSGSYGIANASLSTDASGVIVNVTISSNVGNLIVTTPTISIVNSTGGSAGVGTGANVAPLFHLGFFKYPLGDGNRALLDLLTYSSKTVGSISSLSGINPGENYNLVPFVSAYEPAIASLGKYDYSLDVYVEKGVSTIVPAELVEQTISTSGYTLLSNSFSGNSSGKYDVYELVYQDNGISVTAEGEVITSTVNVSNVSTVINVINGTFSNSMNVSILTVSSNTNFAPGDTVTQGAVTGTLHVSNNTTLVVNNASGTFQANATSITSTSGGSTTISGVNETFIYGLKGYTSWGNSFVISTTSSTITSTSKGIFNSWVLTAANTTHNFYRADVSRRSIFTDFYASGVNALVGKVSGANVYIAGVSYSNTLPIGDNAILKGVVTTSNGAIKSIRVSDSGFGYEQDETANLVSQDGERIATGKLNIINQGTGSGYYSSTRGFLDDNKYIQDGNYYQEYSYEVQSSMPLSSYADILKKVVHVAGTKMFGKLNIESTANLTVVDISSSITIS